MDVSQPRIANTRSEDLVSHNSQARRFNAENQAKEDLPVERQQESELDDHAAEKVRGFSRKDSTKLT